MVVTSLVVPVRVLDECRRVGVVVATMMGGNRDLKPVRFGYFSK
jgi:hypothetical protein